MSDKETPTVWILEDYMDVVRQKSVKEIDKRDKWGQGFGYPPIYRFSNKQKALLAMVDRAERLLCDAQKVLKAAEARVKKCRKKLEINRER
jgi:hypothetical protein